MWTTWYVKTKKQEDTKPVVAPVHNHQDQARIRTNMLIDINLELARFGMRLVHSELPDDTVSGTTYWVKDNFGRLISADLLNQIYESGQRTTVDRLNQVFAGHGIYIDDHRPTSGTDYDYTVLCLEFNYEGGHYRVRFSIDELEEWTNNGREILIRNTGSDLHIYRKWDSI
ncbi:MAG: hypothetical protein LBL71_01210 [Endomicrobium sp.]|nr:hypothetical protein [Endomicrobium sp.]